MGRIPKAGDYLNREDIDEIISAIEKRKQNFPDESGRITILMVLLNIGDRYAPITCIEEEWTGFKSDIPKGKLDPKCPNGHDLTKGPSLRLGWISEK